MSECDFHEYLRHATPEQVASVLREVVLMMLGAGYSVADAEQGVSCIERQIAELRGPTIN